MRTSDLPQLPDGSAFFIATISGPKGFFRRWFHKLFQCPTFWDRKPAFTCPICGGKYRCYWDGHDIPDLGINICTPCARAHEKVETHE